MKRFENYESVTPASEYETLPAGAYVCDITGVTDYPDKEYLKIEYDVSEGDFRGYFTRRYEATGRSYFAGNTLKSYSEKGIRFFKAFTDAIQASNPGYFWNWVEQSLVGKRVGFVIGEEEYKNQSGEIRTRYVVTKVIPIDDVRQGKFTVPTLKKLSDGSGSVKSNVVAPGTSLAPSKNLEQVTSDDLPF